MRHRQSDSGVDRKVLVVPRLDGRYAAVGTVAVLEQVGRLPLIGQPADLLEDGHGADGGVASVETGNNEDLAIDARIRLMPHRQPPRSPARRRESPCLARR